MIYSNYKIWLLIRRSAIKSFDEIRKQLQEHKQDLKDEYGVTAVGVFGSYVRGEQTEQSDVDILVEFSHPNNIDLFDFIELEEFLSKQLGIKVDLVTKSALKPLIKDQILKETIYAWK